MTMTVTLESFRPLTGIMFLSFEFNDIDYFLLESFRPLTGIMFLSF